MERRFQFSTSGALLATFWVAVFFGAAAAHELPMYRYGMWGSWLSTSSFFLLILSPAAAVGAACNRPLVGRLCGSVSAWRSF